MANDRHGKMKQNVLKQNADNLRNAVNDLVPDSREKSLVMTKIDEALLWAREGIERN